MNSSLPSVVITGTGSFAPARVVTNDELAKMVDTSDQWIRERSGILERRWCTADEACSDMAMVAGQRALEAAGAAPEDVDAIIVATIIPDTTVPSAACIVQHRLGCVNAAAFDLNAACSGFVYGLEIGAGLLRGGAMRRVLLIGSEKLSQVMDPLDRATAVLFGDGAGAVVLERRTTPGAGLLGTVLRADGGLGDLLHIPAGGSRLPASVETLHNRQHYLRMRGKEVFKEAVRNMETSSTDLLARLGVPASAIDLVVPHQANSRIIDALAAYLGLPMEKFFVNLDRYGNTSAASIPIALDEAVRSDRIRPGHLVLMAAFGGGLTWGSALVRWA